MDAELTVNLRSDGVWVVLLAREGQPPMEFTCDSERQARAFAAQLGSTRKSYRQLTSLRMRTA